MSANSYMLAATLCYVWYLHRDLYNLSIEVWVPWKTSFVKFFRLGISLILSEIKLFFIR